MRTTLACVLATGLVVFFQPRVDTQGQKSLDIYYVDVEGGGATLFVSPSGQSMLVDTFPPEKRGPAFAAYGIVVIVGPIFGPTLGGWITDQFSWGWVFLINAATFGAVLSSNRSARLAERSLLARLRPLILPSHQENFGVAVAEALASSFR